MYWKTIIQKKNLFDSTSDVPFDHYHQPNFFHIYINRKIYLEGKYIPVTMFNG